MNWQDERGLSLMELLVALALVAVISGALATTTNFGVQLLNRTQSIQEASPQIALRSRLRHWLIAATPPTRLAEFPTDLSGTATQVSFTTTTPTPFAPNSAALRITINATGDELQLTIEEMGDIGDVLETHHRVLSAGLTNGKISYYSNEADPAGWQDTWDNPAHLPSLIRVTGDEGSTPSWPEFTVQLALMQ